MFDFLGKLFRNISFCKQQQNSRKISFHRHTKQKILPPNQSKMTLTQSLVLIICLLSTINCSQILTLTTQSFPLTIHSHKYVMVKFYAPWCSHCKTMAPEYEKLAEMMKNNQNMVIGEVDATVQKHIAEKYQVKGFPTIKLFVDGYAVDYKGQRTAEEMYEWIRKVTQAEIMSITEQEINSLKNHQPLVVYFGTNQTILTTIKLLTIIDPSTSYFQSSQISIQPGSLLFFSSKTPTPISFNQSQPLTLQTVKQWVLINTLDDVIPLRTKEHLEYVFYDRKQMKDVAMMVKERDLNEEDFERFKKICPQKKQSMKCCFVDNSMQIYSGVKSYVRSRGNSILTLTRDTLKQAYTYPHSLSTLTSQSWTQFLQQVTQSKHKNIAAGQNDQIDYQHVKILVTDNYTSFIDENQVVFVEYVSPGCAKCAEFAEEYDVMAKEVYQKDGLNVKITAIDMRKNMQIAAQLQIMDFPSFRLHLSGAHIEYKGSRNRKEMLEFILKTMKIRPIEVYSIDSIPAPSVIIYDPSQTSTLKHVPAIFTRYPVYLLKSGQEVKVAVRHNNQEKTFPHNQLTLNVSSVSRWLQKQTDPILVNFLMTNVDGKLKDALKNQIHLLGLIDVQTKLSASLRDTLELYCKTHTKIVCGYAKKGEDHFGQFMAWAGIDKDITTSEVIYVNTTSFEKFIFTENIEEFSQEKIDRFVSDVKEGKVMKNQRQVVKENKEATQQENYTSNSSDEL